MKTTMFHTVFVSAITLLSLPACSASSHRKLHQIAAARKHNHQHSSSHTGNYLKRSTCAFPTDDDSLVAITPESDNAGWAMSPDQPCRPGHYCPIACKPGMVMAQWDPSSSYTYPASMNGGLFCDQNGQVHKPFPNKPYCVEGTGSIKVVNKCGDSMSWCQTVLPGNEAMLIPTVVSSESTLAVPDTSYWCSTAAHYYINGPGSSASDCVWGTSSRAIGNWAPYVAGANTDNSGETFVKLGWNPIWQGSSLANTLPSFGVKIECDNCNGMPCEISPNSSGSVDSKESAVGAGNAAFCVATVPKGATANIVVFPIGGGGGGSGSDSSSASPSTSTSDSDSGQFAAQAEKPTAAAPPTPSTTEKPTTQAAATTTEPASTWTSSAEASTTTTTATTATTTTTTSDATTTKSRARPTILPGVFHENGTTSGTSTLAPVSSQTQAEAAPATTTSKGEAGRKHGSPAFAGLIIAFVAAACFF